MGDKAADTLVAKMRAGMEPLKVGAYSNSDNDFGPVITQAHQQKVNGYIDSAEADGANIVVDGRNPQIAGFENGFFVGATLIDGVTLRCRATRKRSLARFCRLFV